MTYNDWKHIVNKTVFLKTGYSCDDIYDYPYADKYNKFMSPLEVAAEVIYLFENNKELYYTYNNKYYYKLWKDKVNMIIENKLGKRCDEIDDFNYLECYNEEIPPHQIAYHLINRYNFQHEIF